MTARIVEIMLCILLLSSCASKRKVTTTDVIQSDSVRATAKTDIRIDAVVDTMTTTTGETTVVEIDFFEPVDTTGHPVITIGNDGITINSGNVKSVKTKTTKTERSSTGHRQESLSATSSSDSVATHNESIAIHDEQVKEQTTPSKNHRMRHLVVLVVVTIIATIIVSSYWRKNNWLGKIAKVWQMIVKLFE